MSIRYACCKHCHAEARDRDGNRRMGHYFPCMVAPTEWGQSTCVAVPFEEESPNAAV